MRYWVNLISLYTASVAIQLRKKKNWLMKQLYQTEKYLIMDT